MKSNHELENCLTKAISKFEVRDMLTKFGVPEDAEVTLKMQLGENSQPLARCPVTTTTKKDNIACGSTSWDELKKSITDEFLNPALTEYSFSKYMSPEAQKEFVEGKMPLNISFDSSYLEISRVATLSGVCCKRCPPPNNHLCCRFCPA